MIHNTKLAATTSLLILAGCARAPGEIPPHPVDKAHYADWSCRDLAEERDDLTRTLADASSAQDSARANDKVSVALLGMPVSSVAGTDRATEIGLLKGQLAAIEDARTEQHCAAQATD